MIRGVCSFAAAGILCSGIFFIVKSQKLDHPYQVESRIEGLRVKGSFEKAETFARDLCVITDESQFGDRELTAASSTLFNITDKNVVYSTRAFETMYPASMTKVMTALVVLKYGNLEDLVTVTDGSVITEYAASLCGIAPGDVLTLEQLLYGLMMPSGNDAGNAIAIHMGGSLEGFAEMMNKEAKLLGATHTNFVNPHGLHSENHYTTAYDLYLIFNEAMKYDKFLEVIEAIQYTADYVDGEGNPVSRTWVNGNWFMIGQAETPAGVSVVGGKTGTTGAAGYCLTMLSRDTEGKQYISTIFKAETRPSLYAQQAKLLTKIAN